MCGFEIFALAVFAACVIAILIYGSKQLFDINDDIVKLKDHIDTIEHVIRYEVKQTGEHAGNRISALEKTVKDNYFKLDKDADYLCNRIEKLEDCLELMKPVTNIDHNNLQGLQNDHILQVILAAQTLWKTMTASEKAYHIKHALKNGAELVDFDFGGRAVVSYKGKTYTYSID